MRTDIKKIAVLVLPFLAMLLGLGIFIFYFIPERASYIKAKDDFTKKLDRLEGYRRNAKTTTVRKVVTAMENDLVLLEEEGDYMQSYLLEKYAFTFPQKYPNLSGLDFKNLIVEKRNELGRKQIGLEAYDTAIPVLEEIPELVRRLEISEKIIKIFQEQGLDSLENIQISKGRVVKDDLTDRPLYEEYLLSFNLTAQYDKVVGLLYAIEQQSLFFVVNYCRITRASAEEVKADLTVKVIRFLFS